MAKYPSYAENYSSTYTPQSGGNDLRGTASFLGCDYSVEGDWVTVEMYCSIVPTDIGLYTRISFTLPVPSNFTSFRQLASAGVASNDTATIILPAYVTCSTTLNVGTFTFIPTSLDTYSARCTFAYRIR